MMYKKSLSFWSYHIHKFVLILDGRLGKSKSADRKTNDHHLERKNFTRLFDK